MLRLFYRLFHIGSLVDYKNAYPLISIQETGGNIPNESRWPTMETIFTMEMILHPRMRHTIRYATTWCSTRLRSGRNLIKSFCYALMRRL